MSRPSDQLGRGLGIGVAVVAGTYVGVQLVRYFWSTYQNWNGPPSDTVETFDIYSVDEDTYEEIRIGKAKYGPGGMLTVLQADPNQAEFLNNVAENLNRKVAMVEKLPGLESSRYGLSSRAVQRTDPEFLPVLQNYLKTYYGLSLG